MYITGTVVYVTGMVVYVTGTVVYVTGMIRFLYTRVDLEVTEPDEALYNARILNCLLYTSPSPRDRQKSRMPSSA